MWILAAPVEPVAASGTGFGVFAGGQPHLGDMPEAQIVGRARATHLGWHPAGVDGVVSTSGHLRATAAANTVTKSLLSEYVPVARWLLQSMPSSGGRPPRCMLVLR